MPLTAVLVRAIGGLIVGLALGWWLRHAQSLAEPVEAHPRRRDKPEHDHRRHCSDADRHPDGRTSKPCANRRVARNGGRDIKGGLEGRCAVCWTEPATLGFVHGSVVHCCLCRGCHAELSRRGAGRKCLVCNQTAAACVQVVGT